MQALSQKICQKYGWSARFEKDGHQQSDGSDDEHVWFCFVTVGINDERQFTTSPSTFKNTVEGNKKGMAAAAQVAVDGLREEVARQEAKPKRELSEVFPMPTHTHNKNNNQKHNKNQSQEITSNDNTTAQQPSTPPLFAIRGSSPPNWNKYIWSNKPKIVGIDTEGNQSSSRPPVLVQIATDDLVLLEIPAMVGTPPRLSDDLQRLLADDDIVKVFCDNFAHHDKRSLGLLPGLPENKQKDKQEYKKQKNSSTSDDKGPESLDFSQGTIIDLEALSANIVGPVKVARGLSRIVALSMPELNVLIGKPPPSKKGGRFKSIGRFTLIEQGKAPPLTSLRDVSRKDQHYAAVDAWATLQAYKRLSLVTVASS